MIIYQALSTYQILECIEHRLVFHKNDECGLILGDYIVERFINYKELLHFFDSIFLFRFGGYLGDTEKILREVKEEFRNKIGCELNEIEKFYIAGIHTYLQALMVNEGIEFEMFEDGSGNLSRPWVLADIHKKKDPSKYEFMNSFHLYTHDLDVITRKWCDFSGQLEGFVDDKAVDFNVLAEFEKLSNETQDDILKFFGIKSKLEIEDTDVLVLTQQFSNLGQLTFDEHIEIYTNLLTFYLDGQKIMFKLHPDDIMYYKLLFPEIRILDVKFPSELIPFVFTKRPKCIATITSTGINLIAPLFDKALSFNALYERTFKNDYIYYGCIDFLRELNISEICVRGVNEIQMSNMIQFGFHSSNITIENICSTCIVDDVTLSEEEIAQVIDLYREGRITTLIFMNCDRRYVWEDIDESVWSELSTLRITLSDSEIGVRTHVIYYMCQDERIKDMLRAIDKKLGTQNLKTTIEVNSPGELEMKVHILEGRLEATERRLLQYIKNEKELVDKIASLEGK